jgi:hypothetical protein
VPLLCDSSVYRNPQTGVVIVAYVNDMLIVGPNVGDIKEALGNSFEMEDLGPGAYSPRVRISRVSQALIVSTAELQ